MAPVATCLLILLGSGGYWFWRSKTLGDPEKSQQKQMAREQQEIFATISQALENEDTRSFLSGCRTAIQNHLGRVWNCEPSTITRANIARNMPQQKELIEIMTVAEQAAYGGSRMNKQTMLNYMKKLRESLEYQS